jgi:hypothetical protein
MSCAVGTHLILCIDIFSPSPSSSPLHNHIVIGRGQGHLCRVETRECVYVSLWFVLIMHNAHHHHNSQLITSSAFSIRQLPCFPPFIPVHQSSQTPPTRRTLLICACAGYSRFRQTLCRRAQINKKWQRIKIYIAYRNLSSLQLCIDHKKILN